MFLCSTVVGVSIRHDSFTAMFSYTVHTSLKLLTTARRERDRGKRKRKEEVTTTNAVCVYVMLAIMIINVMRRVLSIRCIALCVVRCTFVEHTCCPLFLVGCIESAYPSTSVLNAVFLKYRDGST